MHKLQDSYFRAVGHGNPQKAYDFTLNSQNSQINLHSNPLKCQKGAEIKLKEYKIVQDLYNDFKKLTHKEIFMYMMDTRDEILTLQTSFDELYSDYTNTRTELVMLKKFYQENSPLKYSKQKYEALLKDYEILKKEKECILK